MVDNINPIFIIKSAMGSIPALTTWIPPRYWLYTISGRFIPGVGLLANPRSFFSQYTKEVSMTNPPGIVPEKVMVFIDAMNLYESLGRKELNINTNIDFYKFACKLADCPNRRLIRVHVYTGIYDQTREPEKYAAQMRFFSRVQRMPFVTLKTRPLLFRSGGYLQKGVDTLIATDMVSMAFLNHYDLSILVSGDGDLAPAADAVKAAGKQIIAAMFNRSRSNAVAISADQEIRLDAAFFTDCY